MFKNKTICVIPARAGSKGIKNKNLIDLNGKPLIAWTIEAALQSNAFDKVYLSSESKKIVSIAKKYGAEIPFIRQKSLADDSVHSVYVVIDLLEWFFKKYNYYPEYVAMLLPTSPLRQPNQISESLSIIKRKKYSSLVSIVDLGIHHTNIRHFQNKNLIRTFQNKNPNEQRQDSNNLYSVNGSIFIAKSEVLLRNKTFHNNNCHGYIMDKLTSIDINSKEDLKFADSVMKNFEPWKSYN